MNDNSDFPALNIFASIEKLLFSDESDGLVGFRDGLNAAFDRLGFTQEYVDGKVEELKGEALVRADIEKQGSDVSKVVKDIIWGMIELDRTTVAVIDLPILQRLRYIRQNGFTYLVFPSASHVRLEHSLGVDYKSVHEMLGVARPGDGVIFVDDNISSGTQFSAQLLRWVGCQSIR